MLTDAQSCAGLRPSTSADTGSRAETGSSTGTSRSTRTGHNAGTRGSTGSSTGNWTPRPNRRAASLSFFMAQMLKYTPRTPPPRPAAGPRRATRPRRKSPPARRWSRAGPVQSSSFPLFSLLLPFLPFPLFLSFLSLFLLFSLFLLLFPSSFSYSPGCVHLYDLVAERSP